MCYIQTIEIWLSQYGPQTQIEYKELKQILNKTEKKGRFSCCFSNEKLTITDMKHGASITLTMAQGLRFRLLMKEYYQRARYRRAKKFIRRQKR